MRKLICLIIVLITTFMLVACTNSTESSFGFFDYNGIYLKSFSSKNITIDEAKEIVSKNYALKLAVSNSENKLAKMSYKFDKPSLSEELIRSITENYAGLSVTTYFYVENEDRESEKKEKIDLIQGSDFVSILEDNEFQAFNQLVAQNIVLNNEIIDYMKQKNEEFKESGKANIAPFKDAFTFHESTEGNLVIQYHDFAEIPSSVGGGVGCFYRQDTEILYDIDNKISKWQTSLGVYTATPEGTAKQGYILEMAFNWTEKE